MSLRSFIFRTAIAFTIAAAASGCESEFGQQAHVAVVAYKAKDYEAALVASDRALEIAERDYGAASDKFATELHDRINVGFQMRAVLTARGDSLSETAEMPTAQIERCLAATQSAYGTSSPIYLSRLAYIGFLLDEVRQYGLAEDVLHRLLTAQEALWGTKDPRLVPTLWRTAWSCAHHSTGGHSDCTDGADLAKRAVSISEAHPDVPHTDFGHALLTLASLTADTDLKQGTTLFLRAANLLSASPIDGIDDDARDAFYAAYILNRNKSQVDDALIGAEKLNQYDLRKLNENHDDAHLQNYLTSTLYLANLFLDLNRARDAIEVLDRVEPLARTGPTIAQGSLHLVLGFAERSLGRHADARDDFQLALTLQTRAFEQRELGLQPSAAEPSTAMIRVLLALELQKTGDSDRALSEARHARAIYEAKNYGYASEANAASVEAYILRETGRAEEALPLWQLAERESARDPSANARQIQAAALFNKAAYWFAKKATAKAVDYGNKAMAVLDRERDQGDDSNSKLLDNSFGVSVGAFAYDLQHAARQTASQRAALDAESFEVAQAAVNSDAARAVAALANRFAVGSSNIAVTVRAYQDSVAEVQTREKDIGNLDLTDHSTEAMSRRMELLEEARARRDSAELALNKAFPDFAALIHPRPATAAAVQALLRPHEALIAFYTFAFVHRLPKSIVWVLRRDGLSVHELDLGAGELRQIIRDLRHGLDLSSAASLDDLPHFDLSLAHDLYTRLLGPALADLADVQHLMFVMQGPLTSLPPAVLVTEPPAARTGTDGYRNAAWLGRRYAISILPSVASLKALRTKSANDDQMEPFAGFGDPALGGQDGSARGATFAHLLRGGVSATDVEELPRLPETAAEVKTIGAMVHAGPGRIFLGADMTRASVSSNAGARIVYFATHGLLAGDIPGLAEPALVLTPQPEKQDNGLLLASDVAQLRMNADWVVLSACNTAAGDQPGADDLSGLARAFLYAGARAMLVSHWPVESGSAETLMTRLFGADARNSRAEALKRAELSLISDLGHPEYAHPAFWAPFVLVGDGD